eukprot:619977-Heterocapsa_arctica.AAC.1
MFVATKPYYEVSPSGTTQDYTNRALANVTLPWNVTRLCLHFARGQQLTTNDNNNNNNNKHY